MQQSFARSTWFALIIFTVVSVAALVLPPSLGFASTNGGPQLLSVRPNGLPGGGSSPAMTPDGRFFAFITDHALVATDTNASWDVYRFDRSTGQYLQVSVATGGAQASNGFSLETVDISDDGNRIVFDSGATNLVAGDTNGVDDVFMHQVDTGTTTRLNVGPLGLEDRDAATFPSISGDGRFVTFDSDSITLAPGSSTGSQQVYVRDIEAGEISLASSGTGGVGGNGNSGWSYLSRTGRYVTFWSAASNLVGGDTNAVVDVFIRDLMEGITERVTVDSLEQQSSGGCITPSAVTPDGRFVAFGSCATNLVVGDTNNKVDIFVRDRVLGETSRVSVQTGGAQAQPSTTQFDGLSISDDGDSVAFASYDSDLIPSDSNGASDVFVHDRSSVTTTRVSELADGVGGNAASTDPVLSGDGRYVAFSSRAGNFAPGDDGVSFDLFLVDREPPVPAADLLVTSSHGPEPVSRGQALTFHVVVTNLGPSAASGVTLDVALSKAAGYPVVGSRVSCDAGKDTVTCSLSELASGASETIDLTVRPIRSGAFFLDATVSGGPGDPDGSNNTTTDTSTVI